MFREVRQMTSIMRADIVGAAGQGTLIYLGEDWRLCCVRGLRRTSVVFSMVRMPTTTSGCEVGKGRH